MGRKKVGIKNERIIERKKKSMTRKIAVVCVIWTVNRNDRNYLFFCLLVRESEWRGYRNIIVLIFLF